MTSESDIFRMNPERSYPPVETPPLRPVMAGTLAVAIFLVDAITPLDMAVAVLYVVVVLLAANFLDRRGVLLVSGGCLALTVVAYLMMHGLTMTTAFGRCLMSVSAIAITAFLALKNQAAAMGLRDQASLLDLTHDTIFVRDMNDVITYWNRAAEELYGWPGEIRSRLDEAGQVLLGVKDTGIGVDPETQGRLFDTFFTTKPDGVGMGLSICRSIIEAHGGEVWVSRNDGPGTTFELTVPSIRERGS